jgi:Ca2+-binding EF-hand superfamily protein
MVLKAFSLLDRNNDGVIKVGDIENIYDVSKHPDFISGK